MERFIGSVAFVCGAFLLVWSWTLWSGQPPHHLEAVVAALVGLAGLWFGWRLWGGPEEPEDNLCMLDVLALFDD